MSERTEIVIVGGGLAGLAAATHAARAGRSVTLLERSNEPGGRARTREAGSFRFNLGPHALYPRSRAELSALGVDLPAGIRSAASSRSMAGSWTRCRPVRGRC